MCRPALSNYSPLAVDTAVGHGNQFKTFIQKDFKYSNRLFLSSGTLVGLKSSVLLFHCQGKLRKMPHNHKNTQIFFFAFEVLNPSPRHSPAPPAPPAPPDPPAPPAPTAPPAPKVNL